MLVDQRLLLLISFSLVLDSLLTTVTGVTVLGSSMLIIVLLLKLDLTGVLNLGHEALLGDITVSWSPDTLVLSNNPFPVELLIAEEEGKCSTFESYP